MNEFQGFAIFSTVVNALSGNAGSIFVSRISTALHSSKKEHYWSVSFALFGITSPILLLFLGFVWLTGQAPVTIVFTLSFVALICIQVRFSPGFHSYEELTLAADGHRYRTGLLPHYSPLALGLRPRRSVLVQAPPFATDFRSVYAIPLLSSFLDVTGQLMLVGAFALARNRAEIPVDPALELGS